MGENIVGELFNRAILDTVVGFIFALLLNLLSEIVFQYNILVNLISSPFKDYLLVTVIISAFLLGSFLDKIAFLALDHRLFAKHFQNRLAYFNLPEWCLVNIKEQVGFKLTMRPSSQADLIHDSKADWISAVFLTRAREFSIKKRADLIANFQFTSNILALCLLALFIVPAYVQYKVENTLLSLSVATSLLILSRLYWKFSIGSLAQVHTYENLVVFGLLLKAPESEEAGLKRKKGSEKKGKE